MKRTSLKDIGEFGLIDLIKKRLPKSKRVIKGIGDDTAVLKFDKNRFLLFTTDMILEDVHFDVKKASPSDIGKKALAVNISDIAAMGGVPKYAVVSLGAPGTSKYGFIEKIYEGMRSLAKKYGVDIVGGDTSRAAKVFLNVALMGEVEKRRLVLRKGAKAGDKIFVTGVLGGSISGKHLDFNPRVREARFLTKNFKVSSMIDVSDGAMQDLCHLLEEDRLGAAIFLDKIPVSKAAYRLAGKSKSKALKLALTGGEDFELLFTLPPGEAKRFLKKKPPCRATLIGEITKKHGEIDFIGSGGYKTALDLKTLGYGHF